MPDKKRTWPMLYKRTAGGKVQEWEIWVEPVGDTGEIHTRYGLQGGKKQHLTDVVVAGKNVGKKNETTPFQQAVSEAESEWKKQLERKGYGQTAEDSAAVRALSPMLAQDYLKALKDVDWATAYGQPKLDGFRMIAVRTEDGLVLKSRENKPIATMAHIHEQLLASLEPGTILDGELYTHGMPFQQIASAVKRRSELSEKVMYNVYDMISEDGFRARYDALKGLVRGLDSVVAVETVVVRSRDDMMAVQQEFIGQGYEGAMLRHGRVGYQAGKRSKHLLKVKTFKDEEFKVVDAKEGRGTHAGMAIFLCETSEGVPFEVTAPGTHEEKRAFWANYKNYVGKMLTVKFFDYTTTEDGKVPRFPVALRFRG